MVFEVTLNFCYCHFISSWGHKGILHQKWISVFCHSGWVYGSILITDVEDLCY